MCIKIKYFTLIEKFVRPLTQVLRFVIVDLTRSDEK